MKIREFSTVGDLIKYLQTIEHFRPITNSFLEPIRIHDEFDEDPGYEHMYDGALVFEPDDADSVSGEDPVEFLKEAA